MSTLKVNAITDTSGGTNVDVPNAAKAWVNFNGTGTVAIRADFNVSSITDSGTGLYTVNFTTAMPDTNYVLATSNQGLSGRANTSVGDAPTATRSTTSCRVVLIADGNYRDSDQINVAIFR